MFVHNEKVITLVRVLLLLSSVSKSLCLNNGLALTPPMGWLTWERFRCNKNCTEDPDNCISEKLIKAQADRMAYDGFREAGYSYVIIDDCWLADERDSSGRLQPDPVRFPSGMKALADYVHSLSLKFGLYEDYGTRTCAGYPGSEYHLQFDMQTFADWGVDYLKLDGCNSDPHEYDEDYPPVQFFLNKTGRPIVYSSEFALHQIVKGIKPNYDKLVTACNLVRNGPDIDDSWESVLKIIELYRNNEGHFAELAGPGYFNDPDELIVGDFSLSRDQQRSHFAFWCLMASPLIMSVDLRNINADAKALLLNKYAIAINQDPRGAQGQFRKELGKDIELWVKPLQAKESYAGIVFNKGVSTPTRVVLSISDVVGRSNSTFELIEVFDNRFLGIYHSSEKAMISVNPGGVVFFTLTCFYNK